ncbi:MAG: phosphatase PAP2 family protein [Nitriliruptor sp.]|uniref:phosphatase PAP2 family protein n=1 Tax=Nitriliruptor sp. TaxID=2448056 RepID=UPI00349FD4FB
MTPYRNWVTALTVATVLVSRVLVKTGAGDPLDRAARDALARPLGNRADVTIGAVTDLGSVYGLGGIAATLLVGGRRRAALDSALAGSAAWIVAQSLKPTLDRPRPYQVDAAARLVSVPAGSSWPSGHSAVAAATATSLSPHLGPVSRSVAAAFVGTVAVSRLYVGVHHLTDVLAGVAVGHLCARVVRGVRRAIWGPRTRRPSAGR